MNFHQSPLFMLLKWKNHDNRKLLLHSICYRLLEYLSSLDCHRSPCWHAAWFYQTLLLLCKWGRVTKEHQSWDTTTSNEIFLPLILMKLSTMMNFVKEWTMMKKHLNFCSRNCHITNSKVKNRIFLGPQIKHSVRDKNIDQFTLLRTPFGRQFK